MQHLHSAYLKRILQPVCVKPTIFEPQFIVLGTKPSVEMLSFTDSVGATLDVSYKQIRQPKFRRYLTLRFFDGETFGSLRDFKSAAAGYLIHVFRKRNVAISKYHQCYLVQIGATSLIRFPIIVESIHNEIEIDIDTSGLFGGLQNKQRQGCSSDMDYPASKKPKVQVSLKPFSFFEIVRQSILRKSDFIGWASQTNLSIRQIPIGDPIIPQNRIQLYNRVSIAHGEQIFDGICVRPYLHYGATNFGRWPSSSLNLRNNHVLSPECTREFFVSNAVFAGFDQNWYHFVLEVLPRYFHAIKTFLQPIPLLLPANLPNSHYELVEILSGMSPKVSNLGTKLNVENLIIPPNFKALSFHRSQTSGEYEFSDETITLVKEMRKKILSNFSRRSQPMFLYVRRGLNESRLLYNYETVEGLVQKFKFTVFESNRHSASQQVEYFQNAKFVIVQSGADCTNLMFCTPGTKVVEISSGDGNHGFWARFSAVFDLEHHLIEGKLSFLDRKSKVHSPGFNLSIRELDSMISECIIHS